MAGPRTPSRFHRRRFTGQSWVSCAISAIRNAVRFNRCSGRLGSKRGLIWPENWYGRARAHGVTKQPPLGRCLWSSCCTAALKRLTIPRCAVTRDLFNRQVPKKLPYATLLRIDPFARRVDEDELLRTQSKFLDRAKVLHGVAAKGTLWSACCWVQEASARWWRLGACSTACATPLKTGGSATELSATGAWHGTLDETYVRLIRMVAS